MKSKERIPTLSLRRYLEHYITVCNHVLAVNENRFPFSQIWQACEITLEGHIVEFCLQDSKGGELAHCPVVFSEKRLKRVQAGACLSHSTSQKYFPLKYVMAVIMEPYKYIANPGLIDWDWMQKNPHQKTQEISGVSNANRCKETH